MANEDKGWRPEGGLQQYKGYEVWDYTIGPHEIHDQQVDPDFYDDEGADDSAD